MEGSIEVDDRENSNNTKNNSSGSGININIEDLSSPLEHVGSLVSNNYIAKRNCIISSNETYMSEEKPKKIKKKKRDKHKVKLGRKDSEWIQLNVGGKILQTTRCTLTKDPNSMLYRMFSETSVWESATDQNGAYLLDRDPQYFNPLLNYLRHGDMIIDRNVNVEGIIKEAEFFQVQGAIESAKKTNI